MDEKLQYDHQKWIEENLRQDAIRTHEANHELVIKANDATIASGQLAIRTILLINGAAAIALLSFLGGLIGGGKLQLGFQMEPVTSPLVYFAWGVVFSAVSMGFGYMANYTAAGILQSFTSTWKHPYLEKTDYTKRWQTANVVVQVLSIGSALVALGAFVCGMIVARNAIANMY